MPRTRNAGISLLEIVMALLLVTVLATFAADRTLGYVEYAEKVAMETHIATLKRALAARAAELLVAGKYDTIGSLRDENPIQWLADPPTNYAGLLGEAASPAEGVWYYDAAAHELVYRPRRRKSFVPGPDGRAEIRFRVEVLERDKGTNATPRLASLTIRPTQPYQWAAEPPR